MRVARATRGFVAEPRPVSTITNQSISRAVWRPIPPISIARRRLAKHRTSTGAGRVSLSAWRRQRQRQNVVNAALVACQPASNSRRQLALLPTNQYWLACTRKENRQPSGSWLHCSKHLDVAPGSWADRSGPVLKGA